MPSGGPRKNAGKKVKTTSTDLTLTSLSLEGSANSPQSTNYLKDQIHKNEQKLVDAYISKAIEEGNLTAIDKLFIHLHGKPGTQEVVDKPTQIILKTNVPRPPIINHNLLSDVSVVGGDHSGEGTSVRDSGGVGELSNGPANGTTAVSELHDGAGDTGARDLDGASATTGTASEWLAWLNEDQ